MENKDYQEYSEYLKIKAKYNNPIIEKINQIAQGKRINVAEDKDLNPMSIENCVAEAFEPAHTRDYVRKGFIDKFGFLVITFFLWCETLVVYGIYKTLENNFLPYGFFEKWFYLNMLFVPLLSVVFICFTITPPEGSASDIPAISAKRADGNYPSHMTYKYLFEHEMFKMIWQPVVQTWDGKLRLQKRLSIDEEYVFFNKVKCWDDEFNCESVYITFNSVEHPNEVLYKTLTIHQTAWLVVSLLNFELRQMMLDAGYTDFYIGFPKSMVHYSQTYGYCTYQAAIVDNDNNILTIYEVDGKHYIRRYKTLMYCRDILMYPDSEIVREDEVDYTTYLIFNDMLVNMQFVVSNLMKDMHMSDFTYSVPLIHEWKKKM